MGATDGWTGPAYDNPGLSGSPIATTLGTCTVIQANSYGQCTFTATFAGGEVMATGTLANNFNEGVMAVVGGTGDYAGASGEMSLVVCEGNPWACVYSFEFTTP